MRSDTKNAEKTRSAHSRVVFSCPQHFASNPGASELKLFPYFPHLFSPCLIQDPLLMLPTDADVDHRAGQSVGVDQLGDFE